MANYEIRPIPCYPGYFATSNGAILSNKLGTLRALKPFRNTAGYLQVAFWIDGKQKNLLVSRLVCLTFNGPPAQGDDCRHLNGNKLDNRPSNLCFGTRLENILDQKRHGKRSACQRGEMHISAKVTDERAREIYRRLQAGERQKDIAATFNICRSLVSHIKTGRAWSHVTQPEPMYTLVQEAA